MGIEPTWLLFLAQILFSLVSGSLLSASLAVSTYSAPLVMDSVVLGPEMSS